MTPLIKFESSNKGYAFLKQGQRVNVWLNSRHNQESFSFFMKSSLQVVSTNNYKHEVTANIKGLHVLELSLVGKGRTKTKSSNNLIIYVY